MIAKALSTLMRYQDDINTEHNMKSICRAAVAQWTTRLTRNEYTRVKTGKAHIFFIILHKYTALNKISPQITYFYIFRVHEIYV